MNPSVYDAEEVMEAEADIVQQPGFWNLLAVKIAEANIAVEQVQVLKASRAGGKIIARLIQ